MLNGPGTGVPNIVAKYGQSAFEITDLYINVILPFDIEVMSSKRKNATVNATVKLNQTEKKIIQLLSENPSVTSTRLAELLGLHRATVMRNLNRLKEKGLLERVGSDKTGYWKIIS